MKRWIRLLADFIAVEAEVDIVDIDASGLGERPLETSDSCFRGTASVCDLDDLQNGTIVRADVAGTDPPSQCQWIALVVQEEELWMPQALDLNQVVGSFDQMVRRMISENIRLDIVAASSIGCTQADPGQIDQLLMNLVVNGVLSLPPLQRPNDSRAQ